MQVPALRDLAALAQTQPEAPAVVKAVLIPVAAVATCVMVGFIAALINTGFHGTIQIIHRIIPFLR